MAWCQCEIGKMTSENLSLAEPRDSVAKRGTFSVARQKHVSKARLRLQVN